MVSRFVPAVVGDYEYRSRLVAQRDPLSRPVGQARLAGPRTADHAGDRRRATDARPGTFQRDSSGPANSPLQARPFAVAADRRLLETRFHRLFVPALEPLVAGLRYPRRDLHRHRRLGLLRLSHLAISD